MDATQLVEAFKSAHRALVLAQAETPPMHVTDPDHLKRLQRKADEAEVELIRRIAW